MNLQEFEERVRAALVVMRNEQDYPAPRTSPTDDVEQPMEDWIDELEVHLRAEE